MNDKVYIVFGDSIAYGYGDDEAFGWVNRLKKHFDKHTFFLNLGVPGDTSENILKRFKNELVSRYNEDDEFTIIYSFGINDVKKMKDNPQYFEIFKKNIEKIMGKTLKYTSNVIILGLLMVDLEIRSYIDAKNVELVDNELKKIAKKMKITYIEMRNVLNKDDLIDGLHPNNIGHEKISNYLYEKMFVNH